MSLLIFINVVIPPCWIMCNTSEDYVSLSDVSIESMAVTTSVNSLTVSTSFYIRSSSSCSMSSVDELVAYLTGAQAIFASLLKSVISEQSQEPDCSSTFNRGKPVMHVMHIFSP